VTQLQRVKTSEAVASHILGLLFDGTLRTGDRIDLDEIAEALGVSRVPVREGLMHLERDGLVRLPHYRGAFVAAFDAATIREAFDLYGLLSALTCRRATVRGETGVLEALAKLDEALARCDEVDEFERLAREFRRVINVAAGGPHLRALLRSFGGLVPAAARFSIEDAMLDERAALRAEFEAVVSGDPDAAARATLEHILLTADNAVDALRRRGILPATEGGAIDVRARGEIAETAAVHGRLLGMLESRGGQQ
jgi:DNA-binding GntR family transcriptional regulator